MARLGSYFHVGLLVVPSRVTSAEDVVKIVTHDRSRILRIINPKDEKSWPTLELISIREDGQVARKIIGLTLEELKRTVAILEEAQDGL